MLDQKKKKVGKLIFVSGRHCTRESAFWKGRCDGLSFIEQIFIEHLLCSKHSSRLESIANNKTEAPASWSILLLATTFFLANFFSIY